MFEKAIKFVSEIPAKIASIDIADAGKIGGGLLLAIGAGLLTIAAGSPKAGYSPHGVEYDIDEPKDPAPIDVAPEEPKDE